MMSRVIAPMLLLLAVLAVPLPARAMMGVCDVRRYGARGDGVTDDTAAIQKALDACGNRMKAPGMVVLDRGVFLSGPLVATHSNEWLSIGKDAVLRASSRRMESWWDPARNEVRPLLLVRGGDLLILGGGAIQSKAGSWEFAAVKTIGAGIHNPDAPRPSGVVVRGNATVTFDNIHIN